MNKYDINDFINCFKMTVDLEGIKKLEEYIKSLEQENQQLKELVNHKHKYASEMEGKYILEKAKLEQLRSWLEEDNDKIKVLDSKDNDSVKLGIVIGLGMCVDKLNEIEGGKNE